MEYATHDMPSQLDFFGRRHHHIFTCRKIPQRPANVDCGATLVQNLWQDDENVDIAPSVRSASRPRTKDQDTLRSEPLDDTVDHSRNHCV